MLTKGLVLAFLHCTIAETLKYGRISTNEAVQVKEESKIREDNNSWREDRETGKWKLNETK